MHLNYVIILGSEPVSFMVFIRLWWFLLRFDKSSLQSDVGKKVGRKGQHRRCYCDERRSLPSSLSFLHYQLLRYSFSQNLVTQRQSPEKGVPTFDHDFMIIMPLIALFKRVTDETMSGRRKFSIEILFYRKYFLSSRQESKM